MPLPDGLRRDDVQIAYPTTVAEVICGDKTGRSSQKKWKASTRVRRGGAEVSLGDWIIDECNQRKADLPAVGQTLQVYWPLDRAWYSGRVLSYTEAQGSTQVVYDDGDVEMLNMVMERYKVSPPTALPAAETSRAMQIMPSPDDVIDLSSSPDDVIDLSFSGDLDALCPHPIPQLTAAAAKFSDLALASQLVFKKEANQPMAAANPSVQTHAPAKVQVHADYQSPGLARKAHVPSPGCVNKPGAKQLIRDALVTKSATQPSAVQQNCAGCSAQTAAKLPRAQHDSSPTSRPKPDLDEGHGSRSHKDLLGSTSGKGLQAVLKPNKRPSLHQLKPNGLRPLPDRPAKAPQHAKQAQDTQQLRRAHLDPSLPQTPQSATLGHSAALGHRTHTLLHAEGLTAGLTAQPGTASQERGTCGGGQHKAKHIKLEPNTQQQQHQQQEVVLHDASPSEASTHAMHTPGPDAAAQTAIAVADKLPSQLLQQFGLGLNLDAAQKQAALEELVLAVADAGMAARFFANLDKHDRAEAEQNLSRYYRSISMLVQSTHGQVQVADVIGTYIDSLC